VKAVTERNPKIVGLVGIVIMAAAVLAILLLNRSVFSSGYTIDAQFPNAAGISNGTTVMVAGVSVGSVKSVTVHGNAVDAALSVNSGVQLPHVTKAAVEVETLLGVVDVTLTPVSGWNEPLKPGAFITDTSVPTEFYQLQNTAHTLLSKTNAEALNSLVTSLANITQDKQKQVAQIISGLGALTTTVDQRSGQVSQLIDSANSLSTTLTSRDQQLLSVINNLNTVSTGLAANDQDLSNLINNVDSMASQTNSLVSQDSPALNSLLSSLHADLNVVGQHQEDLAEGVSYLGSALKGFQSIAYSGSTPVPWGNIFVNPASLTQTFGIIGPCGTLDQVLNQVLGPDPLPCDQQTGPLPGAGSDVSPGEGPATPSGSASSANTTTPSSAGGPSASDKPSSSSSSSSSSGAAPGPNTGLGGLSQLLSPLLGGK
jgi:phospholipid/cholesterol/gamma-HCH transport system substrate-binding protein